MKLTIFPADKGDCLLLEASDGTSMLIDGGMPNAYRTHVRPFWGDRAASVLDLVYVSHIDQDHIGGVLQLMNDVVAWRVHDHRRSRGEADPPPGFPRPPEIRRLWHNSFHAQVGDNAGAIESMLAAAAAHLTNSRVPTLRNLAMEYRNLAVSIPEAIRLSRRASPEQLAIPLNQEFGGLLAFVRGGQPPIDLGDRFRVRVIGPSEAALEALRVEWNRWLRTHRQALTNLEAEEEELEDRLAAAGRPVDDKEIGNRKKVTAPNLASLMLYVEVDGHTLLLTGDGHHEDIVAGLRQESLLSPSGHLHVDVLKVQHHGSEHNISREFLRHITASHYVFCGNGKHENPDERVVQLLLESRLGTASQRSDNEAAKGRFTIWFNSSSSQDGAAAAHMARLEHLVEQWRAGPEGRRLHAEFLGEGRQSLELPPAVAPERRARRLRASAGRSPVRRAGASPHA
jgi:beta-lactamase superfamily II metal-dependent hydrolase